MAVKSGEETGQKLCERCLREGSPSDGERSADTHVLTRTDTYRPVLSGCELCVVVDGKTQRTYDRERGREGKRG